MSRHNPTKYHTWVHLNLGGEVWEIRTDKGRWADDTMYCAHVNCSFEYEDDEYAGLWSWEDQDNLDVSYGVPWCFFCHALVPDEIITIRTLLE